MIRALIVLALTSAPFAAMAETAAERAKIDDAVKAYAAEQDAGRARAADAAVADNWDELLHTKGTQTIGNTEGDVTVIEFFDYQCKFTKAVEPRVAQLVHNDAGVKLVLKPFPILGPQSRLAARAALAAAKQDKFEAYHVALLAHEGGLTTPQIFEIAGQVGLDVERLRKDMDAPEIADALMENFNLARSLKVTSTPTFIAGKHMVQEPSAKIDFAETAANIRAARAAGK